MECTVCGYVWVCQYVGRDGIASFQDSSQFANFAWLLFAQLLDLLHMREGFTRPEFEVPCARGMGRDKARLVSSRAWKLRSGVHGHFPAL